MKRRIIVSLLGVAVLALSGLAGPTLAAGGQNFKATLTGYEEVPSISTVATGAFRAQLSTDGSTLSYELSYSNIENAFAAHIHLGQMSANGGVSAFLCGGGDKPSCPPTGGTVTGTIDAADVIGPTGQGIAAGEFAELIAAMRAGVTYVNVHTSDGDATPNEGPGDFPGGEIRGQVR
jgi:hypothetical protein